LIQYSNIGQWKITSFENGKFRTKWAMVSIALPEGIYLGHVRIIKDDSNLGRFE
jgi:hypothetical protein